MAQQTPSSGLLSGSVNGRLIKIDTTVLNLTKTLIHQVGAGTTGFDEVWLSCYNSDTVDHTLYLLWGNTTADDLRAYTIPAGQEIVVTTSMQRLNNGLLISGYGDVANVLYVSGGYGRVV